MMGVGGGGEGRGWGTCDQYVPSVRRVNPSKHLTGTLIISRHYCVIGR